MQAKFTLALVLAVVALAGASYLYLDLRADVRELRAELSASPATAPDGVTTAEWQQWKADNDAALLGLAHRIGVLETWRPIVEKAFRLTEEAVNRQARVIATLPVEQPPNLTRCVQSLATALNGLVVSEGGRQVYSVYGVSCP